VNWYYLAFARGVDSKTRRTARRVVFVLEALYMVFAVIADFAVPSVSTLTLILLWTGLVVSVATLTWCASREQRRK
jgi:hypothetical protein